MLCDMGRSVSMESGPCRAASGSCAECPFPSAHPRRDHNRRRSEAPVPERRRKRRIPPTGAKPCSSQHLICSGKARLPFPDYTAERAAWEDANKEPGCALTLPGSFHAPDEALSSIRFLRRRRPSHPPRFRFRPSSWLRPPQRRPRRLLQVPPARRGRRPRSARPRSGA